MGGLRLDDDMGRSPSRRLIVPAGCSSWWGVDASTRGVSIATVASDGRRGVSTATFPSVTGAARLRAVWAETCRVAASLGELLPPGLVMVEQPSGARPNPELSYAIGVVMAAIVESTACTQVDTVPSSRWKLIACGNGGIKKPKPTEGREYAVLAWARDRGYPGRSWDEADAWAIAQFAWLTVELDPR